MIKLTKISAFASGILLGFLATTSCANQDFEDNPPELKKVEKNAYFNDFLSTIGGGIDTTIITTGKTIGDGVRGTIRFAALLGTYVYENPGKAFASYLLTFGNFISPVTSQRTFEDYQKKYAPGGTGCPDSGLSGKTRDLVDTIKDNPNLHTNLNVLFISEKNPNYAFNVTRFSFLGEQQIQTGSLTYQEGKKKSQSTQIVFNRKERREIEKQMKKQVKENNKCIKKEQIVSDSSFKKSIKFLSEVDKVMQNKELREAKELLEALAKREETLQNCITIDQDSTVNQEAPQYDVYDVSLDHEHGGVKSITGETKGFEKHKELLQDGKVGIVVEGTSNKGNREEVTCGSTFLVDMKDTDMNPTVNVKKIRLD